LKNDVSDVIFFYLDLIIERAYVVKKQTHHTLIRILSKMSESLNETISPAAALLQKKRTDVVAAVAAQSPSFFQTEIGDGLCLKLMSANAVEREHLSGSWSQ
jgi:hypothetical protein